MARWIAWLGVTIFLVTLSFAARATPARPPAPSASGPATAAPAARKPTPAEIAAASPVPIWRRNGILVEQGGRGLYTYRPDKTGQSVCDSVCERLWPPHYADDDAKPFGPFTIARSADGRPVWAWQGKPLYRWISDRRRGAAGGQGVADAWDLVKVPPELESRVTAYFPMRMPRPGERWVPKPLSTSPVPADPGTPTPKRN